MDRYQCEGCEYIYDPERETRHKALNRGPLLKSCRMIGFVLIAA